MAAFGSYVLTATLAIFLCNTIEAAKPDFEEYSGETSERPTTTEGRVNSYTYKSPSTCERADCDRYYTATWGLELETDLIHFHIETKAAEGYWIGIAFAPKPIMEFADVILAKINADGSSSIADWHIHYRWFPPSMDEVNDAECYSLEYQDGVHYLNFTRKRNTGNADEDRLFDDMNNCYYFLFPFAGLRSSDTDYKIKYHARATPKVSEEKICISRLDDTIEANGLLSCDVIDHSITEAAEMSTLGSTSMTAGVTDAGWDTEGTVYPAGREFTILPGVLDHAQNVQQSDEDRDLDSALIDDELIMHRSGGHGGSGAGSGEGDDDREESDGSGSRGERSSVSSEEESGWFVPGESGSDTTDEAVTDTVYVVTTPQYQETILDTGVYMSTAIGQTETHPPESDSGVDKRTVAILTTEETNTTSPTTTRTTSTTTQMPTTEDRYDGATDTEHDHTQMSATQATGDGANATKQDPTKTPATDLGKDGTNDPDSILAQKPATEDGDVGATDAKQDSTQSPETERGDSLATHVHESTGAQSLRTESTTSVGEDMEAILTTEAATTTTRATTTRATTTRTPTTATTTTSESPPVHGSEYVYKQPLSCDKTDCTRYYSAQWIYYPSMDAVRFTVLTKTTPGGWVGLAFAPTRRMANMDVYLGRLDSNGTPLVNSWYTTRRHQAPSLDDSSNLDAYDIEYTDGMYKFNFTRGRDTGDGRDVAFTDTSRGCFYFMYPITGIPVSNKANMIDKHGVTPKISKKICIPKHGTL